MWDSGNYDDSSELVEIEEVGVIAETDMAILVETEDEREIWIPKSQIEEDVSGCIGEVLTLTIPKWLADSNDFFY